MTNQLPTTRRVKQFGLASFLAATVNTLFLEFATWTLAPWLIYALFILPPIYLIDLIVSFGVSKFGGKIGQAGRGMMIGCISAPLSLIIFVPVFLIAHAMGPV